MFPACSWGPFRCTGLPQGLQSEGDPVAVERKPRPRLPPPPLPFTPLECGTEGGRPVQEAMTQFNLFYFPKKNPWLHKHHDCHFNSYSFIYPITTPVECFHSDKKCSQAQHARFFNATGEETFSVVELPSLGRATFLRNGTETTQRNSDDETVQTATDIAITLWAAHSMGTCSSIVFVFI